MASDKGSAKSGNHLINNFSLMLTVEAGYGSNLDSWEETVQYDYGSITEDSSTATTGKGSVHIQSSPTLYPDSTQSYLYVSQTIPIKPSTTYTP